MGLARPPKLRGIGAAGRRGIHWKWATSQESRLQTNRPCLRAFVDCIVDIHFRTTTAQALRRNPLHGHSRVTSRKARESSQSPATQPRADVAGVTMGSGSVRRPRLLNGPQVKRSFHRPLFERIRLLGPVPRGGGHRGSWLLSVLFSASVIQPRPQEMRLDLITDGPDSHHSVCHDGLTD